MPPALPRPACSKNAAYDFFPCQFQLFYRGRGKGGMWYDPAFQVGRCPNTALHCREAVAAVGLLLQKSGCWQLGA